MARIRLRAAWMLAVVIFSLQSAGGDETEDATAMLIKQAVGAPFANVTEVFDRLHVNQSCAAFHKDYEEKSQRLEKAEALAAHVVVPGWSVVFFGLLCAGLLERLHIDWIPESAVIILWGLLAGFFMKHVWGIETLHETLKEANTVALNLFFLPIIIFESGWSVRIKDFGSQLAYILVFAIGATAICVVIVGAMIHLTSDYHPITDLRTAFAYASLISATDPVATLSTYSSLKVDPLLNIMVFGESLINDAVAIVLFNIMNNPANLSFCGGSMPDISDILEGIAQKLCSSVGIGFAGAVIAIFGVRVTRLQRSSAMMSLYVVALAYIVYAKAEAWNASGIIATLFTSITLNLYLKPHLNEPDELLASFFIKQMASIGDMGIFMMVGVDATMTDGVSWRFTLWIMLFCLVARAAVTAPLALTVNWCKKWGARNRHLEVRQSIRHLSGSPDKDGRGGTWRATDRSDSSQETPNYDDAALLSAGHIFMMWHAGLRGGIALVLCLQLGDWVDMENGPGTKRLLCQTTVAVITVFLLVFGGSTRFCLEKLGIPVGNEYDEDHLSKTTMSCSRRTFNGMDEKLFWPLLVGTGIAGNRLEWTANRMSKVEQSQLGTAQGLGDEIVRSQTCDDILRDMNARHRGDLGCIAEDSDGDDGNGLCAFESGEEDQSMEESA